MNDEKTDVIEKTTTEPTEEKKFDEKYENHLVTVLNDPTNDLHKKTRRINIKDEEDRELVKNVLEKMVSTLNYFNGDCVGLAANQVGEPISMFITGTNRYLVDVYINPRVKLIKPSKKPTETNEGCMSVPDKTFKVKRAGRVKVEYFDENFKRKSKSFTGFDAIVIQHENDHLKGILISDKGEEIEAETVAL